MDLDQEIAQLKKEIDSYHLKIIPILRPSEKDVLNKERSDLRAKLTPLIQKRENQREKQAFIKTTDLIRNNAHLISLSLNRQNVSIPDDLQIEITFRPCGHTQKYDVRNFLRDYTVKEQINQKLYGQWSELINALPRTKRSISGGFNCQKCRKEQTEQRTKFHSYKDTPIGTIRWELHKLQ